MLIAQPEGHYRFLRGIEPYSCGVVAEPGFEIVQVTLARAIPWRRGFERVDAYLATQGLDRSALCAMQLRCPAPFTLEGFVAFNCEYLAVLEDWGLPVDGLNPIARTNVAPVLDPPEETVLHGFSHTRPARSVPQLTLVIAGAGELAGNALDADGIIRRGQTDDGAMRAKAAHVMKEMVRRLEGLGATWESISRVEVYTAQPVDGLLANVVLPALGPAGRHGVHCYHTRPPIEEIEFEMDMRGVQTELFLAP